MVMDEVRSSSSSCCWLLLQYRKGATARATDVGSPSTCLRHAFVMSATAWLHRGHEGRAGMVGVVIFGSSKDRCLQLPSSMHHSV